MRVCVRVPACTCAYMCAYIYTRRYIIYSCCSLLTYYTKVLDAHRNVEINIELNIELNKDLNIEHIS